MPRPRKDSPASVSMAVPNIGRHYYQEGSHGIGRYVAQYHPPVGRSDSPGRQDVVRLAQGDSRGADDPDSAGQDGGGDGYYQDFRGLLSQGGHYGEGQDEVGQRHPHIYDPLHYRVEVAHEVPGKQPEQRPGAGAQDDGSEADQQGDTRAVDHTAEHIPPELVGSEQMGTSGPDPDSVVILDLVVKGSDDIGEDGYHRHHYHHYQAQRSQGLGAQVMPGHSGECPLPALYFQGLARLSFQYFGRMGHFVPFRFNFFLAVAYARVEQAVHQVHHQVGEKDHHGDEHYD